MEATGDAGDGDEAGAPAQRLRPDAIILDLPVWIWRYGPGDAAPGRHDRDGTSARRPAAPGVAASPRDDGASASEGARCEGAASRAPPESPANPCRGITSR